MKKSQKKCATCANAGWETVNAVAACNCCENKSFYTPVKLKKQTKEAK